MRIEPTEFDLVVLGTGLENSLIAGAAAKAGKSVLHVDDGEVYGDDWGSLTLAELKARLEAPPQSQEAIDLGEEVEGLGVRRLARDSHPYSNVEIHEADGVDTGPSRDYTIDLAPKVAYCIEPLIEVLLKSGAHQYLDFRLVECSYIWQHGQLRKVPASRSDVFRDRSLKSSEKRMLTQFLKMVVSKLGDEQEEECIKDLWQTSRFPSVLANDPEKHPASTFHFGVTDQIASDRPFVGWLEEQGLSKPLAELVLYAVAMGEQTGTMTTTQGVAALGLYLASMGRYRDGSGAFMIPYYGSGDLPQAFCRLCAVKGGIYVLRCPLAACLTEPGSQECRGVITQEGQHISCHGLVASQQWLRSFQADAENGASQQQCRLSRAVCVTDGSLREGESQVLVVFPPGSVGGKNDRVIHAIQVGHPVCPKGRFLLYLCCHSTAETAKQDLADAVACLLREVPDGQNTPSESCSTIEDTAPQMEQSRNARNCIDAREHEPVEGTTPEATAEGECSEAGCAPEGADVLVDVRPKASFVCYYNETVELHPPCAALPSNVASCSGPGGLIGYREHVASAEAGFRKLFPDEKFYPVVMPTTLQDSDDEALGDLEATLTTIGAAGD